LSGMGGFVFPLRSYLPCPRGGPMGLSTLSTFRFQLSPISLHQFLVYARLLCFVDGRPRLLGPLVVICPPDSFGRHSVPGFFLPHVHEWVVRPLFGWPLLSSLGSRPVSPRLVLFAFRLPRAQTRPGVGFWRSSRFFLPRLIGRMLRFFALLKSKYENFPFVPG